MMQRVLWLLVAVVLSGCVHPFVQHQRDGIGDVGAVKETSDTPAVGAPEVVRGRDPDGETLHMLEEGYARVGFSFCNAADMTATDAVEQARAVHADTVIVYATKVDDSYSCVASYWVKSKPPVFGVHMQDLPKGNRVSSGTRAGAYVTAVVKDSPAGRAGIVRGDVIIKVGAEEVNDAVALYDAVMKLAGQKVTVELRREDRLVQKEVQLERQQ